MSEPTVGDHAPNNSNEPGSIKRIDDEFAESSRVQPSAEEPFAGSIAEADEDKRAKAASDGADVGCLTGSGGSPH